MMGARDFNDHLLHYPRSQVFPFLVTPVLPGGLFLSRSWNCQLGMGLKLSSTMKERTGIRVRARVRARAASGDEDDGSKQKVATKRAYPFHEIEPKWQEYWEKERTFRIPDEIDASKPKFYVLDMFPYPSGAGLHVGHPLGYTATDILARFKCMQLRSLELWMLMALVSYVSGGLDLIPKSQH